MYQSSTTKYIDYDNKIDKYIYEVSIIDSDFTETILARASVEAAGRRGARQRAGALAIIQIYSNRNLNVAKNLFLYMKDVENEYYFFTIKDQIEYYSGCIAEFKQYLPELNKYIILS